MALIDNDNMDGLGTAIVVVCVMCVAFFWGGWELIDYFLIDDNIVATELITPEIKIVVEDNVVDTLYIYKKP
tara:strand:- start:7 stop:222 length:216 start_codon:yes stop_codon:yes gene_type:complete